MNEKPNANDYQEGWDEAEKFYLKQKESDSKSIEKLQSQLATLHTQQAELVKALEAAERELILTVPTSRTNAHRNSETLLKIRNALAKVKGDA